MTKISSEQAIQVALKCYQSKHYKQTTKILQRLVQHGVQDDRIYLLMGNVHYCLSQYQLATQAYLNGIQMDTNSAVLHANLGNAYVQQGLYDNAIDSYVRAITINPDFPEVRINLIYVYSSAQQMENAIRMCGQVLDNRCNSSSLEVALKSEYTRHNPSPIYPLLIDMYNKLHVDGDLDSKESSQEVYSGKSIVPWISTIKELIASTDSHTLLDYGSGKGLQYQNLLLEDKNQSRYRGLQDYWKLDEVYCYDPAYPPYQRFPEKQYDAVISMDVLEHCPQEDIKWIVDEIFSLAEKFVFINAACYPAARLLPNGENAHCTVRPGVWWEKILQSVMFNYPDVMYCFLVEYFYLDVVKKKRIFQILSNFDGVAGRVQLDSPIMSILEKKWLRVN